MVLRPKCTATVEKFNATLQQLQQRRQQPGTLAIANPRLPRESSFAHLIPSAWQLSSQKPFILDAGVPCGTVDPTNEYLEKDVADKTWACPSNELYYLVVLKGTAATCTTGREGFCKHNYYSAPAGIDKLDGKLWGGVKLDDFVVGGVNGYHANGDKNGWKLADPNDSKTASSLFDMGIRSPGVVGIPNWIDEERFGSHENYPCVPLDVVVPP
ncbi:hypothetical protein VE04_00717 [Pseudogymnoascus sp. 24MN13]|nr:hypothetical protein VE04_00717 [Pseudogymnoascus sp. 24MN13]